jgi:hypothetical protein
MAVLSRTKALRNEIVRLSHCFIYNGLLQNPVDQPLVEIVSSDGRTVIESFSAQMESPGVFYVDYYIPPETKLGTYYDRWTFQFSTMSEIRVVTNNFVIKDFNEFVDYLNRGNSLAISDKVAQMLKDLEYDFIYEATHIPVYNESCRRITEECSSKNIKNIYRFFTTNFTKVYENDVYFISGQKYTIKYTTNEIDIDSNSSSSSSSSSTDSESSSSSSMEEEYAFVFEAEGVANPPTNGTLIKVSGYGPQNITYIAYETEKCVQKSVYDTAFCNWNEDRIPIVRINNRIVEKGWRVDYNGRIYFDILLTPEDRVNVSYHFSLFSKEQLVSFLRMGLQMMNSTPPASTAFRGLDNVPMEWYGPIILYAAQLAFRRMILGLSFQEKQLVYGDPERAGTTYSWIQGLYSEYKEEFNAARTDAKTKKLPQISSIVIPSYTLPGGRSRWFRYLFRTG